MEFTHKCVLIKHLKKQKICLPIEEDIDREAQLEELCVRKSDKENIECVDCNRQYKNKESLRKHKCKRLEKLEKNQRDLEERILELEENPKTLNVTLNCFMDTTGKPIEYLLNDPDIIVKLLKWMNSNKGILNYIDEKFYNKEHPENQNLKIDQSGNTHIFIKGSWREIKKEKGLELVLVNVGNDFGTMYDNNMEELTKPENKRILERFDKNANKPYEWGIDIDCSEEEKEETVTIIKDDGVFVCLEDKINSDKKKEMLNSVGSHLAKYI